MIIMKTRGIILLTILIAGSAITSASAQSTLPKAQHDSLWAVWSDPAQADTNRLDALDQLASDGYLYSQPDSACHYARLQYDFAADRRQSKYMVKALNTQGVAQAIMGNYLRSMEHFHESLAKAEEIGDRRLIANSFNNMGVVYKDLGHNPRSLEYHQRSLKIREEIGDKGGVAGSLNNIGTIYSDQGDLPKALDHYQRSLKIKEVLGDKTSFASSYGNLGVIHAAMGDHPKALDQYQKALRIFEEAGDKGSVATVLNGIGSVHDMLGDEYQALHYFKKSLRISEEAGDKRLIAVAQETLGKYDNGQKNHKGAVVWCEKSLKLAVEMGTIIQQKTACQCLYDAYKALGWGTEALVYLEKISELDKQLNKEETAKKLQQMEFQQVMLQDSIAKAEEARLVQEAHQEEVRKSTRTRNVLGVAGSFLLLLAGGFYSRARYMRRSRAVLQVEKDRSENLLLNILPAEIAEELKQNGRCEARDFDTVSILFTDFKGFTEHSATMSAAALVNEINHCFEAFDGIMAKYGIEKIKTIGDAYMAAGGLPVPAQDSVKNTVLAALEMQKFIRERKAHKDSLGEPAFEMRVGIHTGPVVAGIVGVKKFQYDIWGDTVNTASRMESNGVVGQVNLSETTYRLLEDDPRFHFTTRGKVEAKGKGELEMYLVQLAEPGAMDLEGAYVGVHTTFKT
jgi:adenylate cyclase